MTKIHAGVFLAIVFACAFGAVSPAGARGICPPGFEPATGQDLREDRNGNGMVCVKFIPGGGFGPWKLGVVVIDDRD